MLTLVVTGVSPDELVQVEGDSMGSMGGFAGARVGSSGSLMTSALLVKPVNALDGAATDPDDARVGSIGGVVVGQAAGQLMECQMG